MAWTTLIELLDEDYTLDEQTLVDIRSADVRALFFLAVGAGWTPSPARNGVNLHADDGTSIMLPAKTTSINTKVFRSRVRSILRHRDDNLRKGTPYLVFAEQTISIAKIDPSHAKIIRDAVAAMEPVSAPAEPASISSSQQPSESAPAPETGGSESEPAPTVAARPRHVVKEEPWSAHGRNRPGQGGSETYPSDAVMERTWSDGEHDFYCRWPDCDYVNDVARSVASHYGSHTKKAGTGRNPQPEPDGVDPAWVPRQSVRINRLRKEIDGALIAAFATGLTDCHSPEFAAFLAQWIIDHRIEGTSGDRIDPDEGGPLTAEQILDKIAALADRGRAHILREQVETLDKLVDAERVRADEAEAQAARAVGNIHALRDMLNEAD